MKRIIFLIVIFSSVLLPTFLFAGGFVAYQGQVDFVKKRLGLVFNIDAQRSASFNINIISQDQYDFSINIKHLKILSFDISSDIEGVVEVLPAVDESKDMRLRGMLLSKYSIINYKPVREFSGQFELRDNQFHITSFSAGGITGTGVMDLALLHKVDFTIHLNAVDMDDFLNFWIKDKGYDSSGPIFGRIKGSGSLKDLFLKGSLESFNGYVKNMNYDNIQLNIEGMFPKMQIDNSSISEKNGMSYKLRGPFDLSGQKSFKKQIRSLSILPLVNNSVSQREWTIKRFTKEDSGTTALKYLLRKDNEIGTPITRQSNMLGIERRLEF